MGVVCLDSGQQRFGGSQHLLCQGFNRFGRDTVLSPPVLDRVPDLSD
jgi:hypothetical protein